MRRLSKASRFLLNFASLGAVLPVVAAENSTCSVAVTQLAQADLADAVSPLHLELSAFRKDVQAQILADAEICGGLQNPACAQSTISKALHQSPVERLKKFFADKKEMTCILSRQRSARDSFIANSNMALNLSTTLGTMYVLHQSAKNQAAEEQETAPEFNSALAASMVIFTVYRSIVQCKNELAGAGDAPNGFKAKFKRYTELNLVGNGIYVGLLAGQDVWEGKNPFEKDNLEKYFHEFALSMAWDTGMGVLGIKVMDGFFMRSMPRIRETIAQKIREGVIKPVFARVHGKPTILLKIQNMAQVPGFLVDVFLRSAWTADRTAGFIGYRDTYLDWVIEGEAPTSN